MIVSHDKVAQQRLKCDIGLRSCKNSENNTYDVLRPWSGSVTTPCPHAMTATVQASTATAASCVDWATEPPGSDSDTVNHRP